MKVQYRPVELKVAPKKYKYIILHDTSCQAPDTNQYQIDASGSQVNSLRSYLWSFNKIKELPYHFVCEKIKDDYETIVGRPLQFSCHEEYDDLDYSYSYFSIHVCIMGNFNVMAEDNRLYDQICYRVLSPMMRIYSIPRTNIFLHGELSSKHIDCPGFNFQKTRLMSLLQKFVRL